MELPNLGDDDFDRDIIGDNADDEELADLYACLVTLFERIRPTFLAMMEAGFTEAQAVRFCYLCITEEE